MNKIIWLPWEDPVKTQLLPTKTNEEDEDDMAYQEAIGSFRGNRGREVDTLGPAVVGPMGIIPIHESNCPSTLYKFWMGHTNFDITTSVAKKVSKVPGVETLDIFTRYRFRLGIGKAFDEQSVKAAIEKVTCPSAQLSSMAIKLCEHLGRTYPYWAIYQEETGRLVPIGDKSIELVRAKRGTAKEVACSWK